MREKLVLGFSLGCARLCAKPVLTLAALCVLVFGHASGALSARPKDTDVVATFTSGKITVADLQKRIKEILETPRPMATFPNQERMNEEVTKQLAIRSILLKKAEQDKLLESPEWKVAAKLIDERAVAEALIDSEAWNNIAVSDDEAADTIVELSKAGGHKGDSIPLVPEPLVQGRFWIKVQKSDPLQAALFKESAQKFPVQVDDKPLKKEDAKDQAEAVLTCREFDLTQAEIALLGKLFNRELPSASYIQNIPVYDKDYLSLAALARSKGYPASASAIYQGYKSRLEEQTILSLMQDRLLRDWVDAYTPTEKEIADYHANEWKGMVDAQLTYDAIVVPVSVPGGGSEMDPKAARARARARAEALIAEVRAGKSLSALKAADPSLQIMENQSRLMSQESEISKLMASAQPGQVAAEPYEDFGGFCVLVARSVAPRQKMPLQYVRGTIAGDLKTRYSWAMRDDPAQTILDKNSFKIDFDVLLRLEPKEGE